MTIRQFLSILVNAGIFGNFGAVSLEGWCGVGWVASGIWIKINKSFDPPKVAAKGTPGDGLNSEEFEVLVEKEGMGNPAAAKKQSSNIKTRKPGFLAFLRANRADLRRSLQSLFSTSFPLPFLSLWPSSSLPSSFPPAPSPPLASSRTVPSSPAPPPHP